MKEKIIELFEKYNKQLYIDTNFTKDSFDWEEYQEVAEEIVKLFAIPVVSNRYSGKDMDDAYDKGFKDGNQRDFTI